MRFRNGLLFLFVCLSTTLSANSEPLSEKERLLLDLAEIKREPVQSLIQDLKPHPEEVAKDIIGTSKQIVSRGLKGYLEVLPTEFAEDLSQLSSQQTLLDSGAGEALFAEQYLASKLDREPVFFLNEKAHQSFEKILRTAQKNRAHVVAVDLEITRPHIPSYQGKLRIFTGRYLEEIPNSEIGSVNLISDLYGVFAYSAHLDEVLKKYAYLLSNQGSLYLFLGFSEEDSFAYHSTVQLKNGARLSLISWVQKIPGLRTTLISGGGALSGEQSNLTFKVQIPDRTKLHIPELALKEINEQKGAPPIRNYVEK